MRKLSTLGSAGTDTIESTSASLCHKIICMLAVRGPRLVNRAEPRRVARRFPRSYALRRAHPRSAPRHLPRDPPARCPRFAHAHLTPPSLARDATNPWGIHRGRAVCRPARPMPRSEARRTASATAPRPARAQQHPAAAGPSRGSAVSCHHGTCGRGPTLSRLHAAKPYAPGAFPAVVAHGERVARHLLHARHRRPPAAPHPNPPSTPVSLAHRACASRARAPFARTCRRGEMQSRLGAHRSRKAKGGCLVQMEQAMWLVR